VVFKIKSNPSEQCLLRLHYLKNSKSLGILQEDRGTCLFKYVRTAKAISFVTEAVERLN